MTPRITISERIRHGKPIIAGTRITVEEVLGALAGGTTFKEVEREYGITREDILAAIRYATAWFHGEEVKPLARTKVRA